MVATVNASTSAGVVITPDNSGVLAFQSSSATALTIDASQNATFAGTATATKLIPTGTSVTGNGLYLPAANSLGFSTNGTEAMRINSSGNVLIATTNAITGITGAQLTVSNTSENPAYLNIFRDDTTIGSGQFLGYLQFCGRDATSSLGTGHAYVAAVAEADHGAGDNATAITFGTTPDNSSTMAERMRIDSSGSVGIGVTPDTNFFLTVQSTSDDNKNAVKLNQASTSLRTQISFNNPNGQTGTIQTTGSSTAYNTSSDYRLKENIAPMTGALAKVALLKPVTYKWKVDGSDGEGFIAHELAEVKPDCVSGDKDATREEEYEVTPAVKDEQGKITTPAVMGTRTVPVYQGVDTSFLVATLTAAIQELKAINDTLTARIVALENR
jgi:hypothetical protein